MNRLALSDTVWNLTGWYYYTGTGPVTENGNPLNRKFLLTGRLAIMAVTEHGFSAPAAGSGWLFSMEQGNIFFADTVIISLMAASKKVVQIDL